MFPSQYMMVQNQDMLSTDLNIDIYSIYVLYMYMYKNTSMLQLHQSPYWLLRVNIVMENNLPIQKGFFFFFSFL